MTGRSLPELLQKNYRVSYKCNARGCGAGAHCASYKAVKISWVHQDGSRTSTGWFSYRWLAMLPLLPLVGRVKKVDKIFTAKRQSSRVRTTES